MEEDHEVEEAEFTYVVERKKPERICFGSALQRDTNPIGKWLSPFQKRYASELNPKITPQTYNLPTSGVDQLANKVRSTKGVGGLVNGAPRFPGKSRQQVPSPTRYNPLPRKVFTESKAPFGKAMPKKPRKRFSTPGVGSYNLRQKQCIRTKFQSNFGRPTMVPAVEVICTASPSDECDRCGATCFNDYWHKNHSLYLCHICMEEEKVLHEDYTHEQLKEFEKIRICSYMHNHEGADAAEFLLPEEKLRKRERLENYLSLFISSV